MKIEVGQVWQGVIDIYEFVTVKEIDNEFASQRMIRFEGDYCAGSMPEQIFLENFRFGSQTPVEQDMVNNPPHYKQGGIECIEVTKHMGFCDGNCFKYLYRAGSKLNTLEDLEKALWYAQEYRKSESYLISFYRTWKTKKKILQIAKSKQEAGQWRISGVFEKIAVANWGKVSLEVEWLIEDIKHELNSLGYSPTLNEINGVEK